jgi:hypothetical protein
MSDGNGSGEPEVELSPEGQAAKEAIEGGIRDLVDIEQFKAAGETPETAPPGSGETPPGTGDDSPAPASAPAVDAPADLPTEADATAYLGLLDIAASHDLDVAADEDPGPGDSGPPGWWDQKWTLVLGLFVVAVIGALIAGRLLASAGDSAPDQQPVAVGASTVPAVTPTDDTSIDQVGTPEECVLPPSSVTTAMSDLKTDRGVADAAMFQTTWQTGVTNISDQAVLVAWHISAGSRIVEDEWVTFRVAPGESRQEAGYLTNNAGGTAGDLQWRYVDQFVVLADSPACQPPAAGPSAETQAKAVAVSVPAAP